MEAQRTVDGEKLKVGELARRTGLTVRTLHHWDALGLVSPAERTASGYRLYGAAEVERLQQVVSLRQLGLPLEEIGRVLAGGELPPQRILALQLARLRQEARGIDRLIGLLERLLAHYDGTASIGVDELIRHIEEMTMFEKYYTEEQLAQLAERREAVGEEAIRSIETRWSELTERVRQAMDRGVEPASDEAAGLAREWNALTDETVQGFTGGDAGLTESLGQVWKKEPAAKERWGMSPELLAWIGSAGSGRTDS